MFVLMSAGIKTNNNSSSGSSSNGLSVCECDLVGRESSSRGHRRGGSAEDREMPLSFCVCVERERGDAVEYESKEMVRTL
jgi:hypothetical protein